MSFFWLPAAGVREGLRLQPSWQAKKKEVTRIYTKSGAQSRAPFHAPLEPTGTKRESLGGET